jgi:hypothetical protein
MKEAVYISQEGSSLRLGKAPPLQSEIVMLRDHLRDTGVRGQTMLLFSRGSTGSPT